jgi:DNA polymerase III delta prime subunit
MPAEFFGCQQGHVGSAFTAMVEKHTSKTSFNASGLHYFIFDEVDSLSKTAQAGMKTTLNSPRSVFILTTNNITQLDNGVKDRCVLIDMNAPPDSAFLPLARQIAADENVILSDAQLLTAIAGNNGSFRSVIFQVLRLAKRTARQNVTAATAAAAVIQQAANKK